jgi:3-hydroxy-3-methylglutaryl CoA synthase
MTSVRRPNKDGDRSVSNRGITALGAYLPRRRLLRKAIAAAHAWANPNASGSGTRAICSADEDSLTMAVAAARHALAAAKSPAPQNLFFASTSMPFSDRQNATLIGEALALNANLRSADNGGSQRAGTGALIGALESDRRTLVIASEKRHPQPGSAQELLWGDGAAALFIDNENSGEENLLARFLGSHSLSIDFVDHYRSDGAEFDYMLEERWIREQGHLKIVPQAVTALLEKCAVPAQHVAHFIVGGIASRNARTIAAKCGIANTALVDDLFDACGDTGSAHPLLLLAHTLQNAQPGAYIVVTGFGQGCDVLLFEATEQITRARDYRGVAAALDAGIEDDNYLRYLSHRGLLQLDWGMRAERDNRTAQAAFYRHRGTVTGFIGGRCSACDTPQFPKTRVCVNPACRQTDTQIDEAFKDKRASVKSFTEDWLALSYNPPLMYGNVRFDGGGVTMLEFTDFAVGELQVGTPLDLQFRIKDYDDKRKFFRYCWKAVPASSAAQ